ALRRILVPETRMEKRRARMILVRTWPLQPAQCLEARVAHAGELRRERTNFVPDIFGRRLSPIDTHASRDLAHDPDLVARVARRIDRFAHPLHATLAIRHRAF